MAQYKDDGFELVNDDHTDDPTYDSHRKRSYGSYDNDDRCDRDDRYDRDDDQKYSSRRNSGYDDDEDEDDDDKRPVNPLQKVLSIDPKSIDSAMKAARRIQAIIAVVVFVSIFGFVIYNSVLLNASFNDDDFRESIEKAAQEERERNAQKMREAEMAEKAQKAEQARIAAQAEQAEKTEKKHFYSELLKMAKILQDKPAFDKSYYEYLISRLLDLSLTPKNLKEINEIAAAFGEKIHDTIDVAPSDDIVDYKTASEQFGKLYIQLTEIEPSEFEKYESQLLKLMSSPEDYYAYKAMKTTFEKQLKSSKKANKKSKRKSKEK